MRLRRLVLLRIGRLSREWDRRRGISHLLHVPRNAQLAQLLLLLLLRAISHNQALLCIQ